LTWFDGTWNVIEQTDTGSMEASMKLA